MFFSINIKNINAEIAIFKESGPASKCLSKDYVEFDLQKILPNTSELSDEAVFCVKFKQTIEKLLYNKFFNRSSSVIILGLPVSFFVVRFFSLPAVVKKDAGRAVVFEAQKYLPYKLSEVDYFFQYFPASSGKINVVFTAAKKSLIDRISEIAKQYSVTVGYVANDAYSLQEPLLNFCPELETKQFGICYEYEKNQFMFAAYDKAKPVVVKDISLAEIGDKEDVIFDKLGKEIQFALDYFAKVSDKSKDFDKVFLALSSKLTDNFIEYSKKKSVNLRYQPFCADPRVKTHGSIFSENIVHYGNILCFNKKKKFSLRKQFINEYALRHIVIPSVEKILFFIFVVSLLLNGFKYSQVIKSKKELNYFAGQNQTITAGIKNMPKNVNVDSVVGFRKKITDVRNTLEFINKKPFIYVKIKAIADFMPDTAWVKKLSYVYKYDYKKASGEEVLAFDKDIKLVFSGFILSEEQDAINKLNNFTGLLKKNDKFMSDIDDVKLSFVETDNIGDTDLLNYTINASSEKD